MVSVPPTLGAKSENRTEPSCGMHPTPISEHPICVQCKRLALQQQAPVHRFFTLRFSSSFTHPRVLLSRFLASSLLPPAQSLTRLFNVKGERPLPNRRTGVGARTQSRTRREVREERHAAGRWCSCGRSLALIASHVNFQAAVTVRDDTHPTEQVGESRVESAYEPPHRSADYTIRASLGDCAVRT